MPAIITRRGRICRLISNVRYHDQLIRQIKERLWLFLMLAASIMSTDGLLDFPFRRITRQKMTSVIGGCDVLPVFSGSYLIAGIYVAGLIDTST